MQTIELNKKVASIEVADDKIIINLEQKYVPEDGEYFYVETKDSNRKYVAIKRNGLIITANYCYCGLDRPSICWGAGHAFVCYDHNIKTIRPATKEEIELLDKTLQKYGEKWNPETKQIEAFPKVGDFCIFWGNAKSMARCGILSEVASDGLPYRINYGPYFKNCIPFQSAEHFKAFIKGSDK